MEDSYALKHCMHLESSRVCMVKTLVVYSRPCWKCDENLVGYFLRFTIADPHMSFSFGNYRIVEGCSGLCHVGLHPKIVEKYLIVLRWNFMFQFVPVDACPTSGHY